MTTYPRKCIDCGAREVVRKVETRERTTMYGGRHHTIVVYDEPFEVCLACGERFMFSDDTAYFAAIRRTFNLLEPGELKRAREAVGLSVDFAAELLDEYRDNIRNWEAGITLPSTKYSDAMKRVLEVADGKA